MIVYSRMAPAPSDKAHAFLLLFLTLGANFDMAANMDISQADTLDLRF